MGEKVKVKIKKLDIISFAGFQAISLAFLGLILGIISLIIGLIISSMSLSSGLVSGGFIGGIGIIGLILYPIGFGIIGFISGIVVAFFFNLTMKIIGGLRMDLEETN